MDNKKIQALKKNALELRIETIREIANLGAGHIGGSMSIVEVITYLYNDCMRYDAKNPKLETRDRLVCSKGHAGPVVYAQLAMKGFFDKEWLLTLNKGGTNLPSHCDMTKTPGVDFTTGSLGQGASAAVGIALGQKLKNQDSFTYLILGDGESQEGQVWEAAQTASQWKLGNLIAFTDYNKLQLDGYTDDILSFEGAELRYKGFNWHVQTVNGHDFEAIETAIKAAKAEKNKPSMIILDTIKAKGYIFGEGISACHSMPISKEQAEEAVQALIEAEGK